MSELTARIAASIAQSRDNMTALIDRSGDIARAAEVVIAALKAGRTIFFCGNGGSSSDAAHLAAELSGRFLIDRTSLPAVALGMNNSSLTAIGNDFGYENVFSRELDGLGRAGDVLVGITTSGNSANVLKALGVARTKGMATIGLTGQGGGKMKPLCDVCLCVPSASTPRVQEMHIVAGHLICELAEAALAHA
jgi:D-sedoheptulose 7-phosphate isomerase